MITKNPVFICPIYMVQHRVTKPDKNYSLNLNVYRNLHYIINNNLKKEFKDIVWPQLVWIVYDTQLTVNYKLYWRRISDLDNWQAVITKYFQDALVDAGCIPDDNFNYIRMNTYEAVEQDKVNPRMCITILPYKK